MKKMNLISKAEMKNVRGGDDPISFCVPVVLCFDVNANKPVKIEVGECGAQENWAVCYSNGYGGYTEGCVPC
ncbi:hypothetical protein VRU48_04325 [Pedobacter sp. KR3-3]|uniref:Class I lanthipeptide n=1 Tax=Pedobacter albus TaxID=3113905 RepID=A0ABU7I4E3_9SPHI|nr:hypothetical protein [Pedobacter sp. KR3-3]MEE1944320.1 hypothetical protein [Pedobacter sp. KR3-3]